MPIQRTTARQESPELAAAGTRLLHECFGRIDAFPARIEAISIEPDSVLDELDELTSPVEAFSVHVRHLATSASDHLGMLRRYIDATETAPAMAGYTLVRSAVESAALGIWLLNGRTSTAKMLNSLRLSWRNEVDAEQWAIASGIPDPEGHKVFRETVEACLASRRSIASKSIEEFPRWGTIVRDSARWATPTHAATALQVWKGGSAFVHANQRLSVQLLESRQEPGGRRLATRLATLAKFTELAVDYTECLLGHIERDAVGGTSRRRPMPPR